MKEDSLKILVVDTQIADVELLRKKLIDACENLVLFVGQHFGFCNDPEFPTCLNINVGCLRVLRGEVDVSIYVCKMFVVVKPFSHIILHDSTSTSYHMLLLLSVAECLESIIRDCLGVGVGWLSYIYITSSSPTLVVCLGSLLQVKKKL